MIQELAVVDAQGNKLYYMQGDESPRDIGSEISYADSSYYDKYQFQPYNPAELWQKKGGYRVFDQMREDDQISSALTLKKLLVLSAGWEIECEDEAVEEYLEWNLKEYLSEIFDKKLFQIMSAMDYGFSLSEKIFEWADYDGKSKIAIKDIKTRAPHTFELHLDKQGNLEHILQHTGVKSDLIFEKDKFSKFILYSYNAEFDNPYGKSDLDTGVYRAWWSKNAIIKFWNIYLERYGVPPAIATIPRSAGTAEKNTLMKMLDNLQAKSAFILPEDFKLEFMQITKGTSDFEAAINKYDSMIARKMLLPDLLGFSGRQTSGGSYALGKEQFDLFYHTIEYIRQDIQNLVNREIIQPLILWNFGTGYDAKWKFKKIGDDDKAEFVKMWLEGVKTGKIPTTPTGVNWFLETIHAPEVTEEEFAKMEEEKQAFKDQLANNQNQDGKDGNSNEKTDGQSAKRPDEGKQEETTPEKEDSKKVGEKQMVDAGLVEDVEVRSLAQLELTREYTKYEKKVDFKRINNDFEEMKDKWVELLAKDFKLSINRLIDEIKRKKIVENKRLALVNGLTLPYLTKIKQSFKKLMQEANARGRASSDKKYGLIDYDSGLNEEDVIEWLERNSVYVSSSEAEEILKRVKGTLIDSIRAGNSIRDTISQLEDSLEGYDYDGGASRIETIVRTVTGKAYNEARAQQFKEIASEITAYQFSAIMDGRTSDVCAELDGKIFPPAELDYFNPPLHFNCRSLIIPVFKDEEFNGYDTMPATDQEMGGFLTLSEEA